MTARPGTRARRRAPVEDVTVLVLTRPGGPLIDPLLDALAAQTRRPSRVVLTGLDPDDDEVVRAWSHPLVRSHQVDLLVADTPQVAAPRGSEAAATPPWSAVVDRALAELPLGPGSWVWVLHDDSFPEPEALERLVAAVRQSSAVGAAGPKLVEAEAPRRLVGVGVTATRAGRPTGEDVAGLVDQGQLDRRRDVLGVPLAGLVVRAEVLREVGGLDRVGDGGAEGLDLSWRCHLAGHRVVVAPSAVVQQGQGSQPSAWRRRVGTRHVALARESWWKVPFRALGVLLTSLLAALVLLLVKRPREAALEWADVVAVLSPARRWGARWRFRGRRRVRRRDLQTLFDRSGAGWRSTVDTVQDAVTPRRGRRDVAAGSSRETGPVDEDAQSLEAPDRRRWSPVPWLLLAVVTAIAVVRWRDHWGALVGGGRGLTGPELPGSLGVTTSSSAWHALRDAWHGPGLGSDAPAEPWLLPLTALAWLVERMPGTAEGSPGAVGTAWLLLLAPALSAVAAYLAARTVLPARLPRLALALVWVSLPPVSEAAGEARVGPALALTVLPLVVAAFVVSARAGDGARRTAAAFGGALALAVAGLGVPGLLVVGSLAGLALFVLGPGFGRLRGLVLAVLPWLLQGPWLAQVWQDPRLVLGGPGATTTAGAVPPWQTVLLHAGGPQSLSLWWTAPLLLVALLGMLRRGAVGRRAGLLGVGWLLGLAAALAAPLLELGQVPDGYSDAGATVTAWPGSYLAMAAACALLAAGAALAPRSAAAPSQRRAQPPWQRWASASRGPTTAALAGVAGAAGVALLVWSSWTGLPGVAVAASPAPAVVTEQARGGEAMRMLELRREGRTVAYRLHSREVDGGARDRVRELSPVTSPAGGAGARRVVDVVGALTGDPRAAEAPEVRALLHDLAIGYIGLAGGSTDEQGRTLPLAEELDAVPGLTRLSEDESLALWRVGVVRGPVVRGQGGQDQQDQPVPVSRARLLLPAGQGDGGNAGRDGDARAPGAGVPVAGDHGRIEQSLPDLDAVGQPVRGRAWLQVSEGQGWQEHAEVRADGRVLEAQPEQWPATYRLPEETERVTVEVPTTHDRWWLATALLAGLSAFLALPLGAGRRRKELGP